MRPLDDPHAVFPTSCAADRVDQDPRQSSQKAARFGPAELGRVRGAERRHVRTLFDESSIHRLRSQDDEVLLDKGYLISSAKLTRSLGLMSPRDVGLCPLRDGEGGVFLIAGAAASRGPRGEGPPGGGSFERREGLRVISSHSPDQPAAGAALCGAGVLSLARYARRCTWNTEEVPNSAKVVEQSRPPQRDPGARPPAPATRNTPPPTLRGLHLSVIGRRIRPSRVGEDHRQT